MVKKGVSLMSELGDLIRKSRKELGITTSQLANILEISQGYISHIENGQKIPSTEILRKISKVLNLDVGTLMTMAGYVDGWKDELSPSLRVHFDRKLNKRLSAFKTAKTLKSFEDFLNWIKVCLDDGFPKLYTQEDLERIFSNKEQLSEFIYYGLETNEGPEDIENEHSNEFINYNVHLESGGFVLDPLKLEDVLEKAQTLTFKNTVLNTEDREKILKILSAVF